MPCCKNFLIQLFPLIFPIPFSSSPCHQDTNEISLQRKHSNKTYTKDVQYQNIEEELNNSHENQEINEANQDTVWAIAQEQFLNSPTKQKNNQFSQNSSLQSSPTPLSNANAMVKLNMKYVKNSNIVKSESLLSSLDYFFSNCNLSNDCQLIIDTDVDKNISGGTDMSFSEGRYDLEIEIPATKSFRKDVRKFRKNYPHEKDSGSLIFEGSYCGEIMKELVSEYKPTNIDVLLNIQSSKKRGTLKKTKKMPHVFVKEKFELENDEPYRHIDENPETLVSYYEENCPVSEKENKVFEDELLENEVFQDGELENEVCSSRKELENDITESPCNENLNYISDTHELTISDNNLEPHSQKIAKRTKKKRKKKSKTSLNRSAKTHTDRSAFKNDFPDNFAPNDTVSSNGSEIIIEDLDLITVKSPVTTRYLDNNQGSSRTMLPQIPCTDDAVTNRSFWIPTTDNLRSNASSAKRSNDPEKSPGKLKRSSTFVKLSSLKENEGSQVKEEIANSPRSQSETTIHLPKIYDPSKNSLK